ncbi:hypothetical protein F3Y22_tig00116994pilonHSYRG00122 [Hibiscus syriacus]|uniref:RNase H type-1 domain-containing protein n=1 Tax=Hibiscus syriacus TaxID=106335 RepID=A0A6A2XGC3_HIBSY|nr:hypothetical protein F3Y22_tig00116994pilonHSYRG00122 [Hibiscus syriacus]
MEHSSMWRACASKRAFRIGVLCAILTPVAKVQSDSSASSVSDPLHHELWAIMDGISLATVRGFHSIEVETGSTQAIRILSFPEQPTDVTIVRRIRAILRIHGEITWSFIHREGNKVVDVLAKLGLSNDLGLVSLNCPPPGFQRLLDHDMGISNLI